MFAIGPSLRQARQQRGLDLADVEQATRIRCKYLAALEEERFEVLPGAAYVRGFLRGYGEFLGLDCALLVAELDERFAETEEEPPIQPATLARPPRRLSPPIVALGASALFAVVVVWQLGFTTAKRTPIPPVSAAAPRVHSTAAPKAKPQRKRATPARHVQRPAVLVVRAVRGDCWVAVRIGSATGPVVFQQVVGRGREIRFGLRRPLWVRLGAPWNTDVTLRGKRLAAFPRQVVNIRAT